MKKQWTILEKSSLEQPKKNRGHMNWFKKHKDTVATIATILGVLAWMNGKFNDIGDRFTQVDRRFSEIEKDTAVIKAVLMVKEIMPKEFAVVYDKNLQ